MDTTTEVMEDSKTPARTRTKILEGEVDTATTIIEITMETIMEITMETILEIITEMIMGIIMEMEDGKIIKTGINKMELNQENL